ncbi:MAG: pyridoxal-phosphate dependent enzyme [Thiomicrorhabdus sp.]|nr:pyridoxal-phosphate dependent enzyme [Thiomicrorhabdus sp.]
MIAHKKRLTTPLTRLYSSLFIQHDVQVWVKRDDQNHPLIQGNKWHKLKNNLMAAQAQGKTSLVTFGGAYSNHIAATAAAAQLYGLQAMGIIRGDELEFQPEKWSHTLKTAQQHGMQLQFASRQTYRQKNHPSYLQTLQNQYPHAYILPEGGSNELAIMGFKELMQDINRQYPEWTHLFCPVGTGGTFTGLTLFSQEGINPKHNSLKKVVGVAVLKQGHYLLEQIENWLSQMQNQAQAPQIKKELTQWKLLTEYHDGGYGKKSQTGIDFQNEFEKEFAILLDPIYTSKAFYAFYDQLKQGLIPKGSKIILMHTGGLQGRKQT